MKKTVYLMGKDVSISDHTRARLLFLSGSAPHCQILITLHWNRCKARRIFFMTWTFLISYPLSKLWNKNFPFNHSFTWCWLFALISSSRGFLWRVLQPLLSYDLFCCWFSFIWKSSTSDNRWMVNMFKKSPFVFK